jgi:hypothetical protein
MTRYRVIVQGRTGSDANQRGFYTARFVEAESEATAVALAMSLVKNDERVASLQSECGSSAMSFEVDDVLVLESDDDFDPSPQGFIFYDESDAS